MVVENGAYAVTGAMKAFPNQHALQMHGIRVIGAIGCFGTFECLQALLAANEEWHGKLEAEHCDHVFICQVKVLRLSVGPYW